MTPKKESTCYQFLFKDQLICWKYSVVFFGGAVGFSLCKASSNTQYCMSQRHTTGPRLSPWTDQGASPLTRQGFTLTDTAFHPWPDRTLSWTYQALPWIRRSLAPAPCVRLCLYNPAESCSCTTRKALPLQSAKGLHPLYSGPIKHKRIILSVGIILLSFICFEQNPKRSFHILQKLHILILSSVTTACNGQMVDIW